MDNMDKDIFDILITHEDGYSNLLKYFYEKSNDFNKAFTELVFDEEIEGLNILCRSVFRIKKDDQTRSVKVVPDIVLYNEEYFAIIEVKVGAGEGSKQTKRYYDARKVIQKDLKLKNIKKESYKFLTIFEEKASCVDFGNITWNMVSECLEKVSQDNLDELSKLFLDSLKTRINSAYDDYPIKKSEEWTKQIKKVKWSGAKSLLQALLNLEVFQPNIDFIESNCRYWDGYDNSDNKYCYSALFIFRENWVGKELDNVDESTLSNCYEFHFEFKYSPEDRKLKGRLDYHLHPYYSKKDIEGLIDENQKIKANKCNEIRQEVAKEGKKKWEIWNGNVEEYAKYCRKDLLWLVSFEIDIDERDTVAEVLEKVNQNSRLEKMIQLVDEVLIPYIEKYHSNN